MSQGTCPTIKIDDGKGSFIIINASDFNESKHSVYSEKPQRKAKSK